MYEPSRRPENATDLVLDRASVGVNGENTFPRGDTTTGTGQRSPLEHVMSASNWPAPATDLANGGGLPPSSCGTRSLTSLLGLANARASPSASRSSRMRARQRSDSYANSSDFCESSAKERQCAQARRSSPSASNERAARTCHLTLVGSVSVCVSIDAAASGASSLVTAA